VGDLRRGKDTSGRNSISRERPAERMPASVRAEKCQNGLRERPENDRPRWGGQTEMTAGLERFRVVDGFSLGWEMLG